MDNCAYISRKINPGTAPLLNLLRRCDSGFFLESSLDIDRMGRYSFFGIEPFSVLQYKNGWITHSQKGRDKKFKGNIFNYLRGLLDNYKLAVKNPSANPPFLGGAVGFLSYDLGFYLENIARKNSDDLNTPDLWFAFFDTALIVDNYRNEATVFSTGFPEKSKRLRKIRAKQRLSEFINKLDSLDEGLFSGEGYYSGEHELKSNFTYNNYIRAVNKSRDYITKGDIYQINLS
ncbi:MAG: hypothetical protein PHY56_07955, partial [Candidatus Omnitrophica bacterium]|nr:hypothetical protein [Candidatus Omnitrophota bacterium]